MSVMERLQVRTRRLSWAFACSLVAACLEPTNAQRSDQEAVPVPLLSVELRVGRTDTSSSQRGIYVTVKNADPRYAVCLQQDGMPTNAELGSFFQVFSMEGREIPYIGTRQGVRPFYPSLMYIRPEHSLQSFVPIEEGFPGALAPGACIAMRLYYVNCRAIEHWDFYDPPEGPLPGEGEHHSHWRVTGDLALDQLGQNQRCGAVTETGQDGRN